METGFVFSHVAEHNAVQNVVDEGKPRGTALIDSVLAGREDMFVSSYIISPLSE